MDNIIDISNFRKKGCNDLMCYVESILDKYADASGWDVVELLEFIWEYNSLPSEFTTDYRKIYSKYSKSIDKLTPRWKLIETDDLLFRVYTSIMVCIGALSAEHGIRID